MIAKVLGPLITAEEWILETLHGIGFAWGLAIIVLTLLVRVCIVPLTVRQFRSQQRLAAHAPELKRLKERHAGNAEQLREETMSYYREHKISPLAALAPLLLQIPVFISLYYLMRQDVRSGLFQHAGFLFIPDLTARPHGTVLALLILAYTGSQLAASLVATRTMEGSHRKLAMALPLLFVGFATRFPAGLLVYWITSSVWNFGQQLALWRARAQTAVADAAPPESVPAGGPVAMGGPPRPKPHSRSKKKHRRRRSPAR